MVSDTTADPAGPFAALLVTASGTLKITTVRGSTVSLAAVNVGQIVPIATKQVWSTGTGATVIGLRTPPYKGPPATS